MLIFNLPSLGNVLFYSEDFLIDGTIVTHTGSLESGWLLYMPRYLTLSDLWLQNLPFLITIDGFLSRKRDFIPRPAKTQNSVAIAS